MKVKIQLFIYYLRHETIEPSLYGIAQLDEKYVVHPIVNTGKIVKILFNQKKFTSKLPFNGYKKPTKYLKHTSGSKLKSSFNVDAGKKCCGNEWLFLLDEPVYDIRHHHHHLTTTGTTGQDFPYDNDDIKPVVEHIEDDLKYDFRTNTHSF